MGRVFHPTYTKKDSTGETVTKTAKAWYIEYTDAAGRTRRKKAGASKEAAQDVLRKAEADVVAQKYGFPTERASEILCLSLAEEYLRERKNHVCTQHHDTLKRQLNAVFDGTRAVFIRDLTPEAIDAFIDELRDGDSSARTVNSYLVTAKGFLNWAVKRRKIPYNPLGAVQKLPKKKVRERRPLSDEECGKLLWAAGEGPLLRLERSYKGSTIPLKVQAEAGKRGQRNALIYQTLLDTGLRVDELRHVKWSDVDFDKSLLHCREEWTKNGKNDVLPLSPSCVERFRQWKLNHNGDPDGFLVKVPKSILKTFNDDLKVAGIKKRMASGKTVDMHSLRHTLAQRLNDAGVDPKTYQALLRHRTATMTLGVYVHRNQERMRNAVSSLPELAPIAPDEGQGEMVSKTGTDDQPVTEDEIPPVPPSNRQAKRLNSGNRLDSGATLQYSGGGNPKGEDSQSGRRGSTPLGGTSARNSLRVNELQQG